MIFTRLVFFPLDYEEEKECVELRGKTVDQAFLSRGGKAYVLTDGKLACKLSCMVSLLFSCLCCDE